MEMVAQCPTMNAVARHCMADRSAIFFEDDAQRALAELAIEKETKRLGKALATTIESAASFAPAEEYHQKYLQRRGQTAAKGDTTPIRCYG